MSGQEIDLLVVNHTQWYSLSISINQKHNIQLQRLFLIRLSSSDKHNRKLQNHDTFKDPKKLDSTEQ